MNSPAVEDGINFIISSQNQDGGWGYKPGQASIIEAASSSLLSLYAIGFREDFQQRAVEWLSNAQNSDGGWGINQWDHESSWQTAWALLALASNQADPEIIKVAMNWLLDFGFDPFEDNEAQEIIREQFNIDTNLNGWPWRTGEAAWIEPTALSLLALHSSGIDDQNNNRMQEAVRYLDDRRCVDGGWNFGNPVMFSKELPPRTYHTSLSILALSNIAPGIIKDKDINTLLDLMNEEGRTLSIAFGILALKGLEQETSQFENKLVSMQNSDGSWEGNVHQSAVALLALSADNIILH
jgi:hypothetical protein